jgi:hypothetical protein
MLGRSGFCDEAAAKAGQHVAVFYVAGPAGCPGPNTTASVTGFRRTEFSGIGATTDDPPASRSYEWTCRKCDSVLLTVTSAKPSERERLGKPD